jgi:(S)-ureidoglycine aminohydrolase
MKTVLVLVLLSFPLALLAQRNVIQSKMYSWKKPVHKATPGLLETQLFSGEAYDFAMLSMTANSLSKSSSAISMQVTENEEFLILIRDGTLQLHLNDSTWLMNKGSVALLMPGEKFTIQTRTDGEANFYLMKYRSKIPVDPQRGRSSGGSDVILWDSIAFKQHERGGIRNYFERPTAMCRRFEMHVTTLNEGIKSHEPHTHRAEEIVLVIDNKTEMQIAEQFYKGGSGDLYFLGSDVSHAIRNDGKGTCLYFAFQFE